MGWISSFMVCPISAFSLSLSLGMLRPAEASVVITSNPFFYGRHMASTKATTSTEGRDLILTRSFKAPSEKLFNAWTQPVLLKQWFAPLPWTIADAILDVRVGGTSRIVMRNPEGEDFPGHGVYLEVVKNSRLVFTDAFTTAWELSDKPFLLVVLTFEEQDKSTKYTARVRHWTTADRKVHEKMGFHQGWVTCAEQLAVLVE